MPSAKPKPKKSKVPAKKKTSSGSAPASNAGTPAPPQTRRFLDLIGAVLAGGLFGLSAPGFDQWYLAWFGLIPLIMLMASSTGLKQAFLRGFLFGTAYNAVYLNWGLHLYPLDWLGFSNWESAGVVVAALLMESLHQGLIVGILAAILRLIPMTGGFTIRQVDQKWCAPAMLVIPILWVLVENKIGNAHGWLGIPWAMVEYSQYKFLPIAQIASIVGGIGLGAFIVLVNCTVACLIATCLNSDKFKSLVQESKTHALGQTLAVTVVLLVCVAFGYARLAGEPPLAQNSENPKLTETADVGGEGAGSKHARTWTVSVLQGNINIEMQKNGNQRYTLADLDKHYERLAKQTPAGLVVFTESALPTYLKEEQDTLAMLTDLTKLRKRSLIVGSIDRDANQRPFNSAFGISQGKLLSNVYHKRYLVPFGEYMPSWVKYFPEWIQRLTSTPAGTGFDSGKFPVVIDLAGHRVAPLICFETLAPELVASSVRDGGDLLVNVCDLAWFHESMCGDQMIAFAAMRSIETGRDSVFAANTGPSAIIDRLGRVLRRSPSNRELVLTGKVTLHSDRTIFVDWFN